MRDERDTQATASTPKPFMHLHQASAWLGMSKRQGEYEAKTGKLKVFWIASHPHVLVSDLHAYIDARVQESDTVRVRRDEKRRANAKRRAGQNHVMATCAA